MDYMKTIYKKIDAALVIGISIFLLLWLGSKGVSFTPDSQGYLQHEFIRKPLYPLLLDAVRLFSPLNWAKWLGLLQVLAVVSASAFAALRLRACLKLGTWFSLAAYACFVLPLLNFQSSVIGNFLMTEALAYTFFLLFTVFLTESIFSPRFSSVILFFLCALLGMLTKSQYVFLLPVAVLFAIIGACRLNSRSRGWLLLGVCAVSFVSAQLLERSYHRLNNGYFETTSGSHLFLLMNLLYMSGPKDVSLYSNPDEKNCCPVYTRRWTGVACPSLAKTNIIFRMRLTSIYARMR